MGTLCPRQSRPNASKPYNPSGFSYSKEEQSAWNFRLAVNELTYGGYWTSMDVPGSAIGSPAVRLAFFKEVGQQSDFQAVLEHDLIGSNARARRTDERRA